jgi:4-hydroxy-tetrahydrodipicolinate reductase
MNTASVPVLLFGAGALGSLFVRAAALDPRIDIVAVVDTDRAKVGRSVAAATGESGPEDVIVQATVDAALAAAARAPIVAVHMTESRPVNIVDDLVALMEAGLDVVSAAESMFRPGLRYPEIAAHLDAVACATGRTITGTGINPGYVFDQLVLDVAAATTGVTSLSVDRAVVVADTGPGDVEHVGFGTSEAEFRERIAAGTLEGHMGLPESFAELSERLGIPFDRIEESWEPVTSDVVVPSAIGDIAPGHVVGIVQGGVAYDGDRAVMHARLAMYYSEGIEESFDRIELTGLHDLTLTLTPAAVSILGAAIVLANTVLLLPDAPVGLVSVLDLNTRRRRTDLHTSLVSTAPGSHRFRQS